MSELVFVIDEFISHVLNVSEDVQFVLFECMSVGFFLGDILRRDGSRDYEQVGLSDHVKRYRLPSARQVRRDTPWIEREVEN